MNCKVCREPADAGIVDCIGLLSGSWAPLCNLCNKVNDLLWDFAIIHSVLGIHISEVKDNV